MSEIINYTDKLYELYGSLDDIDDASKKASKIISKLREWKRIENANSGRIPIERQLIEWNG